MGRKKAKSKAQTNTIMSKSYRTPSKELFSGALTNEVFRSVQIPDHTPLWVESYRRDTREINNSFSTIDKSLRETMIIWNTQYIIQQLSVMSNEWRKWAKSQYYTLELCDISFFNQETCELGIYSLSPPISVQQDDIYHALTDGINKTAKLCAGHPGLFMNLQSDSSGKYCLFIDTESSTTGEAFPIHMCCNIFNIDTLSRTMYVHPHRIGELTPNGIIWMD